MFGWSVAQVETEKRRLVILRYLALSPRYEAAAQVLRLHCDRVGVPTGTDKLLGALVWLAEQELIVLREPGDEPVARLTTLGREVADGVTTVPGVLRPDP
jgi:hypothetical protein